MYTIRYDHTSAETAESHEIMRPKPQNQGNER
jgi:hypothetical protein